jgi:hypothetical protein
MKSKNLILPNKKEGVEKIDIQLDEPNKKKKISPEHPKR